MRLPWGLLRQRMDEAYYFEKVLLVKALLDLCLELRHSQIVLVISKGIVLITFSENTSL